MQVTAILPILSDYEDMSIFCYNNQQQHVWQHARQVSTFSPPKQRAGSNHTRGICRFYRYCVGHSNSWSKVEVWRYFVRSSFGGNHYTVSWREGGQVAPPWMNELRDWGGRHKCWSQKNQYSSGWPGYRSVLSMTCRPVVFPVDRFGQAPQSITSELRYSNVRIKSIRWPAPHRGSCVRCACV